MVTFYRLFVKHEEDEIFERPFWDADFKGYLTTFFRETTLHGFEQVIKQPGILKKLFWVLAMLLCATGLTWELYIFFTNFVSWEASTTVSITGAKQLYFPAITICNNNPVTNSWYQTVTKAGSSTQNPQVGAGSTQAAGRKKRQVGQQNLPQNQQNQQQGQQQAGGTAQNQQNQQQAQQQSGTGQQSQQNIQQTQQQGVTPRNQQQPNAAGQPPRPNYAAGIQDSLSLQAKAAQVEHSQRITAGHQLCDMVLQCQYGGVQCDPGTNFSYWHWSAAYGNCYTFNGGYRKANSPAGQSETNTFMIKKGDSDSSGVRLSTSLGDTYGLYLLLFADVSHYLPTTKTVGWRIVIHNQTEMPFPDENGILVGPGVATRIGLEMQYAQRLGVVSNYFYDAPYSDCVVDETLNLDDPGNAFTKELEVGYSDAACSKTCYQRTVMKSCSCFDFNYPNRGPAFSTITNAETLPPCNYDTETQWRCKEGVALAYRSGQLDCDCPRKCRLYTVDRSVSTVKWPNTEPASLTSVCQIIHDTLNARINGWDKTCTNTSYLAKDSSGSITALLQQLRNCISQTYTSPFDSPESVGSFVVGKQFSEVYIYYKDFNYQTIIESQAVEFSDLLAYLGGIFGLFFGFSFLTFFEFVQLIIDCIGTGIARIIMVARKGNGQKVGDVDYSVGHHGNHGEKHQPPSNDSKSAISRSSTAELINKDRFRSYAKPSHTKDSSQL